MFQLRILRPINKSNNSCFTNTEIIAKAPPSASEPVSPINTFAGFALKIKKPSNAPVTANANNAISACSLNSAITPNAANAIDAVPATRPSKPSVKLTALEKPTKPEN